MKITRQKHAKKNMGFYKHNFQFREPFQVLVDGTFCHAALRNKIQIREQLPGYLGGATQLCTTRYCAGRGPHCACVGRLAPARPLLTRWRRSGGGEVG